MKFENQYLTYSEYEDMEGMLDEVPFNISEYEIEKQIDSRTQGRLKNIENDKIPQEVKMCILKLLDIITTYNKTNNTVNKNIKSENTDGYSVSYITGSEIQQLIKSKSKEIDDIIDTYLNGVIINNEHLIYIGVN